MKLMDECVIVVCVIAWPVRTTGADLWVGLGHLFYSRPIIIVLVQHCVSERRIQMADDGLFYDGQIAFVFFFTYFLFFKRLVQCP